MIPSLLGLLGHVLGIKLYTGIQFVYNYRHFSGPYQQCVGSKLRKPRLWLNQLYQGTSRGTLSSTSPPSAAPIHTVVQGTRYWYIIYLCWVDYHYSCYVLVSKI